jgi:hypothetical protein
MVVIKDSGIKISLLERLIVNHAILPDYFSKCVKSLYKNRKMAPLSELSNMWKRHIEKYHKLRVIKRNQGSISDRTQALCNQNYCGRTRLYLVNFH